MEPSAEIAALAERAAADHWWYSDLLSAAEGPPPLTRSLLDAHYYEGARPLAPNDQVFTTSGTSTGKRRRIVWAAPEMAVNSRLKQRRFADHISPFRRCAIDVGLGLAASSAKSVFDAIGATCVQIPYDLPVAAHVDAIRSFGAEVLYSMPSFVESLLHAGAGRPWPIRKLVLVGEVCSQAWARETASGLGISPSDVLDTYGCVEAGLMAVRCPGCGRFHFVDEVIPEVLRPSEIDPAWPDGFVGADEGVLAVTSRYRRRMPIVRYVTYDLVRGFGPGPCGTTMRDGVDAVLGRVGDEIKHGERVSLYDIERAVLSIGVSIRWQVVLDREGRLALEVPKSDLLEEQVPLLLEALARSIPCIGEMIASRILRPFEVRRVDALRASIAGMTSKRTLLRA